MHITFEVLIGYEKQSYVLLHNHGS